MKVSRERLQIIGKMISVLREEKRQNKQNNWTQIKFCENICSPNTLKSIESGKVGRSDMIYEQLLEKLGLKYGEFPVIDDAMKSIADNLHTAIEYFNIYEIKKFSLKGMAILDNAKEYIYYADLYMFIEDVLYYYSEDRIISEERAIHYLNLLNFFGSEYKDLIKVLIFSGIMRKCICDVELYKKYVNLLEMEKSDYCCLKIILANYYHKTDERVKMISLIQELEQELLHKNNYIRLIDTYNSAIVLMAAIDRYLVDIYIEKALNLIESPEIPISKKSETYANIADSFHNGKKYKEALSYFEKSTQEGCENLVINYILIADCQNHLDMPIKIPKLEKKYTKKFPKEIRMMYNYFLSYNDEEVPALLKQSLLIKRVAPLLQDQVLIDIFSFELKKLVKETNSYKSLYIFDEIIEKNLRKISG